MSIYTNFKKEFSLDIQFTQLAFSFFKNTPPIHPFSR